MLTMLFECNHEQFIRQY